MSLNTTHWQSKVTREIANQTDKNNESIALIDSQSVLEVRGPDAEKFLQGQCSADIASLTDQNSLPGCICTVKGRVLCTFVATKLDDRILLRMSAELIAPMREYLGKYAAFFKVELIEWQTPCVIETNSEHSFQTPTITLSYQLNGSEFNEYLVEADHLDAITEEISNLDVTLISEQNWSDEQIDSGWLNLTQDTTEKYLPHQLNLERLNAISFTKGCYTGQEIIARTEYRGKPKRRMQLVKIEGLAEQTLTLPTDILDTDSDKAVGIFLALSSDHQKALAILPIENSEAITVKVEGTEAGLQILDQPYPPESA